MNNDLETLLAERLCEALEDCAGAISDQTKALEFIGHELQRIADAVEAKDVQAMRDDV